MTLLHLIPVTKLKTELIHESPDELIDHLVVGQETNLGIKTSSTNLDFALKQDSPPSNFVASVETPVNGQNSLRTFVPEYI